MESTSLEVFKNRGDVVLRDVVGMVGMGCARGGSGWIVGKIYSQKEW